MLGHLKPPRCLHTPLQSLGCRPWTRPAPQIATLTPPSPYRPLSESWLPSLDNAGSIFMGRWTPESVGDYASGTNHVLPTYG